MIVVLRSMLPKDMAAYHHVTRASHDRHLTPPPGRIHTVYIVADIDRAVIFGMPAFVMITPIAPEGICFAIIRGWLADQPVLSRPPCGSRNTSVVRFRSLLLRAP